MCRRTSFPSFYYAFSGLIVLHSRADCEGAQILANFGTAGKADFAVAVASTILVLKCHARNLVL